MTSASIRRQASPALLVATLMVLPVAKASADWTYPACAATQAWNKQGDLENIWLCLARNGDLWRGAAVHRDGVSTYGAVSVWYSQTYCNYMPEATLVAWSSPQPLYTKTVTNDGYHPGAGRYCVIYRHEDAWDVWYNQVAEFNEQLQLLRVFGDPDRD